jgi:RNA polymerase sigma-70 factor (sigma-E family)
VSIDPSFEAFVEARSAALLRTAYLLTGDRNHAEDLLQSALLRTLRHWPRASGSPDAYVRRVLVNLSHDRMRRLFRRPREAPLPPDPETLPGTDSGIERVTERRAMMAALARLSPRQRHIVVLRYFEDLSVEQTAMILSCSVGTVKSSTSRALSRLRELLAEDTAPILEVPHAH